MRGVDVRRGPAESAGAVTGAAVSQLVVILDDDSSVRRALRRLLQVAGFRTHAYARAEELLAAGADETPVCLVLDIHLAGGMTGFEVCSRLRAAGFDAPVVFVTAFDDAPTRAQARRAGASAYLCKPFDAEELIAAVRAAAAGAGTSPRPPRD